ncbi:MAG: NAD-dependent epimerase [Muribaculaceae bacterium]|nr:NAD-dependent epimerase [Muribaculaceae bacterium]MDE6027623.1 NAD-dependent epimerase [Muribaculaceae bacterium]
MKILVTGAAGFIGANVSKRLLELGHVVVGLDNINDYYDPELKHGRLSQLGVDKGNIGWYKFTPSLAYPNFSFIRMNLEDTQAIRMLFANGNFDVVINLGAQAGVRYSIENPHAYIESNVDGFINILEGCRDNKVKHLVYASSSSVYGLNGQVPFSEHHGIAHPVSLYAATKKSNELMAHAYSKLYNLPTTGLRFFTVYGPWGRPDMSPFLFMDAILHDRPINVFNNGDMLRDFTYIDDVVEGIVRIIDKIPSGNPDWNDQNPDPATSTAPYRIYNIGNQHPTKLMDYINCIEKAIGREAKKNFLPMQPGDVYQTYADSSELSRTTGFSPNTDLQDGIDRTVKWFKEFYNL